MPGLPLAYIRVSSRAQDHATQRSAIERFAAARGDVVEDWRAEKKSAKTMDRPELARIFAEARSGALRGRKLYLYRLDRLTRTGISDTLNAIEELLEHGVVVVSIADGFDLQGPHWDIIAATMAWAAKMERLAINERISAARDRIESEGGSWGRPSRMDKATRAKAHTMYDNGRGRSVRDIARALKVPRSTVGRELAKKPSRKVGGNGPPDPSRDSTSG